MKIGIVGLGYVGLPLLIQFANSGAKVLGIDLDEKKVDTLNKGQSYIKHIAPDDVKAYKGRQTILRAYPETSPIEAGILLSKSFAQMEFCNLYCNIIN